MNVEETIRTRRSVHDYRDEDLDDGTLERIFERVRYTPSGYNLQPWEFFLLRDEDDLERLQACAGGQAHVTDAAAAVVVLGNLDPAAHAERVFDDWLEKGYLDGEDARDGLLEQVRDWRERDRATNETWTTRSTALAGMTLLYAAWAEGVASCPMEGFDDEAVREEFDVGEGYEPVMLVTLGYPEEDADDIETERKMRRPVEEIVHEGEFDPREPGQEHPGESEAQAGAPADDD